MSNSHQVVSLYLLRIIVVRATLTANCVICALIRLPSTKIFNLFGTVLTFLSYAKILTRKPRYRKDDHTVRPVYGCPGKFWESLTTPGATFSEIANGLLL